MTEWREVMLGDLCDRVTVGHVGKMADEYVEDGVPFLRSQNVSPFTINRRGMLYINEQFHQRLAKSTLRTGDVVVIRTGYPGTAAVIPPHFDNSNCADLVVITPSDQLNPYMLAAVFNSAWGRSAVGGQLVGAAQQHFNVGSARALRIRLPGRDMQDRIAAVLCALTDLMENNRLRIELLEQTAQAIYREWFVEFRYPGHEDVPLVDSDLGPIPQGWAIKRLGDVAQVVMGQSPKSEFYNEVGTGLPFHQGVTNFGQHFPTNKTYSTAGDRRADRGDILFSVRAPVGRINVATSPMILGRGLCSIRPDAVERMILLYQLKHRFRVLDTMGTGAIFNAVKRADVEGIEVVWPQYDLIGGFEKAASPLFDLIRALTMATENLRATRDLLLPRLISGEIDVLGLDIKLGTQHREYEQVY